MYRKITHNIVEEHFDHPMAEQIKKTIDRKSRVPNNIIFDSSEFRNDVVGYFQDFGRKVLNIVAAMPSSDDQFIAAFEDSFNGIDNLGTLLKNFYQYELPERFNLFARSYMIMTFLMAQASKMGKDPGAPAGRLSDMNVQLADVINQFIPNWRYQPNLANLNSMTTTTIDLVKAKAAKNTVEEARLTSQLIDQLNAFSGMLASSILNQLPDRFKVATATNMNPDGKDIM